MKLAAFLFVQNVRFVQNVSKRAKCPKCLKCPKTGKMSKMSRNGRNVLNVPKRCAIIMLRVSEISSPETENIAFPGGKHSVDSRTFRAQWANPCLPLQSPAALALSSRPYRSATKKATLCAMHGVSVSAQTTQNTSLGQRSEAGAVSKEHGLLSVRINRC